MKFVFGLILIGSFLVTYHVSCNESNQNECDKEEEKVEICAQKFLLYRNHNLPHNVTELEQFCRENKANEKCLSDHSKKCLSHSANQAIAELIRSIAKQNRAICSSKNRKRLMVRANQCFNAHSRQMSNESCYDQFVHQIHGIHQFNQESKIPVICCNYHNFLGCLQKQTKSCSKELSNAINRLVQNYGGETLNYVCREFKVSDKCKSSFKLNSDISKINEEIPQSFFSLLVKIYLS